MDTFLRPSTNDDEIGRLNQRLLGVLRGDTDNEELLSFRQSVLDRTSSIPDPQERRRALGNLALINEDAVEQLGKVYELPSEKNRQGVTKWYNHFKDEWVQGKSTVHPVERINKWIDAKLSSAASTAEADSIKTGGMSDVGRFVGEVVKAPVEIPFRAGVDVGNFLEGDTDAGGALFGTSPERDPVANMRTGSQVLAGLTGVEPTEQAYFSGNFDPATEEYSEPNAPGAIAYAAGAGAREVVKALSFGALLSRAGATEAISSATGSAVGKIAPSAARYAVPAAQEITASIPVFMLLGAGGRGEAGEGVGGVTDLAKDAATGALFGGITAAFQQGGRAFFASRNPAVNQLGAALERSGGELTDDVIGAFKKIGDPAKVQDGINTAVAAARAFDTKIAVGEVATQFVAGYTLDIAQGAPVEDALVNGVMFGVLDVARAKGIRINENEAVQLRSVTKQIMERGVGEAKITNPAKQPVDLPPDTDAVALSRIAENPPPEADRYGAEIQVPVEAVSYNYAGAHRYPHGLERVPVERVPVKPLEWWTREYTKRLGSMVRVNKNLPQNVAGAFWHRVGVGAVKDRTDATSAIHEITGHFLDSNLQIVTDSWLSQTPEAANELSQFFQPAANDTIDVVRKESFAAWTQSLMNAPQATMAATPVLTQRVRERIGDKAFDFILKSSEEYRTYLSLDPSQAILAQQVDRAEKYPTTAHVLFTDLINNLGYDDVRAFKTNWVDMLEYSLLDQSAPIVGAIRQANQMRQRVGDKPVGWLKLDREALEQNEAILSLRGLGGLGRQQEFIRDHGVPMIAPGDDVRDFYDGTEGGWNKVVYEQHGITTPERMNDVGILLAAQRAIEIAERKAGDIFDAEYPKMRDLIETAERNLAKAQEGLAKAQQELEAGRGAAESTADWQKRRKNVQKRIREWQAKFDEATKAKSRADVDADNIRRQVEKDMGTALESAQLGARKAAAVSRSIGQAPEPGHLATRGMVEGVIEKRINDDLQLIADELADPNIKKGRKRTLKKKEARLRQRLETIDKTSGARVTDSMLAETDYGLAQQAIRDLQQRLGPEFVKVEAATESARKYMDSIMQLATDLDYIPQAWLDKMRLRNQHYATLERVVDEYDPGSSWLNEAEGSDLPYAAIGDSMIAKGMRIIKKAVEEKAKRDIMQELLVDGAGEYHDGTNKAIQNTIARKIGTSKINPTQQTASSDSGAGVRKSIEKMRKEYDAARNEIQFSGRLAGETDVQFTERMRTLRKKMDSITKRIAAAEEKLMDLPALDDSEKGQVIKVRRVEGDEVFIDHYVIPDRLLFESINQIGKTQTIGPVVKAIGFPARVMRSFITLSPFFMPRNIFRGSVMRAVVGTEGGTPIDSFLGKYGGPEARKLMAAAGGAGAGRIADIRNTYNLAQTKAKKKMFGTGVLNIFAPIGKLTESWLKLAEHFEEKERSPEFVRAFEQKMAEGADPNTAARIAASRSRGLADYYVIGAHMREINYMVPFTNAALQSMLATLRNVARNPKRAALNWGLGVALPSIAIYELSRAMGYEEEYLELPAYQRDFFWNIKLGPDLWFRLPKPFEIGVLASGVERAYAAAMYGHENQLDGYTNSALRASLPDLEGLMFGPMRSAVELMFNYDYFRQRPIIPTWEAKLDVELREGKDSASRLGQMLYGMSGVDPRQWDFLLRSQFGDFAMLAQTASNIGRDDQPFDYKRLFTVRGPVSGARSVQVVLKEAERLGIEDKSIDQLKTMLRAYYSVDSAEHRDMLGKSIREYARGIEKYFLPSWRLKVGQ